jgi:glycosyltransferase involved in cell wall biosynthesis
LVNASPPVSVLVCTRDRTELVTQCVRAILASLRAEDEVIVVDAGSGGVPDAMARLEEPRLRWITTPLPGKTRQLNLGIRHAHNEVIAITDDDCLIAPGWISAMAAPFLERDLGLAFGPTEGLSRLPGAPPETPPPGPAPTAMWRFSHGAAMAVRRAAAIDAGGFDERLGPGTRLPGGEEADLLLRMQSRGWRCFVADAPAIRHVEWRTSSQEVRNLLVYERGAGAWIGAAIRRGSPTALPAIMTRLRYQCAHLRTPGVFALRAEIAFCSGLAYGLRLTSRRFLKALDETPDPRPPADPSAGARPIERIPWPSVYGRRCLCLTEQQWLPGELNRRRASEVVVLNPRDATVDELTLPALGRFDLVVAHDLAGASDPVRLLRALAAVCEFQLLSIERIHLWLTLLGRRKPYVARDRGQRPFVMNGAAHRRMLAAGGFEVQVIARPWIVRNGAGGRYAERAILTHPANLLDYSAR